MHGTVSVYKPCTTSLQLSPRWKKRHCAVVACDGSDNGTLLSDIAIQDVHTCSGCSCAAIEMWTLLASVGARTAVARQVDGPSSAVAKTDIQGTSASTKYILATMPRLQRDKVRADAAATVLCQEMEIVHKGSKSFTTSPQIKRGAWLQFQQPQQRNCRQRSGQSLRM